MANETFYLCVVVPAGIAGYLYVKGVIRMNWILTLLASLLKNNGTGTDAGTVDTGDLWDSLQMALVAALAIGGEAALKSLETFANAQTGLIAAIVAGVVLLGRAALNYVMNNKPKV